MAKKKQKSNKSRGANTSLHPGNMALPNFAQLVFNKRINQFQKNGSMVDDVYEGLDFDSIRTKRRISAIVQMAEEVKTRYRDICPDIPDVFSLAEDWVIMNAHPVSAFDHIEKYVFSTLGAAIWILDHIRDNAKTEQLNNILRDAPLPDNVPMPDIWDPCHSQQLLRQIVSIINKRNSDCPITEKAIRKSKATVTRIYMDRPTAENKIDHNVPSRRLYDQVISLIDPESLSAIEDTYKEKYWDWLRRYFLCRAHFNQEDQKIKKDIEAFHDRTQAMATQNAMLFQTAKPMALLSATALAGSVTPLRGKPDSSQLIQAKTLELQSVALYKKQEEFDARFSAFTRDIGEFSSVSPDYIASQYGEEIAEIWKGFEIDEPYSMCMAFLSLLDRGSDLPWCYFPSVILQSCYVSMLPWTRTRFIPCCDDIWEHYDAEADAIVPGPSPQSISRKIKIPDSDNWYQMKYHDAAKTDAGAKERFNLSHILYEVTGCLMPRNPERHLAALTTLNRYGINRKKENQTLLSCMALLGEAKHQSQVSRFPVSNDTDFEKMPDSIDALQEEIIALREELSQCRHILRDMTATGTAQANYVAQLKRQITYRDIMLHDLSSIVFDYNLPIAAQTTCFPYRTASNVVVFSVNQNWNDNMKLHLPDIVFTQTVSKENSAMLRSADAVWIQPKDMSHEEYQRIVMAARVSDLSVRIFPFADVISCATLLMQADIAR